MRAAAMIAAGVLAACSGGSGDPPAGPVVHVAIAWPGASPAQVEREVLEPLEQATNAIAGVRALDGVAAEGLATVDLQLGGGSLDDALSRTRTALEELRPRLPTGVEPPTIMRARQPRLAIIAIAPADDREDPRQRSARGRELQRQLERLAGVAAVEVCGIADDTLEVRVDPQRLAATQVTALDVAAALRTDTTFPAGQIDTPNAVTIRMRGASDVDDVGDLRLNDRVRLRDVADIARTARTPCTAYTGSGPRLVLTVALQDRRNLRDVVAAVRATGAEVLPPTAVVGHLPLPELDDREQERLASELLKAGATAVQVRTAPRAVDIVAAVDPDSAAGDRQLTDLEQLAAQRAYAVPRWSGGRAVGVVAFLAAPELDPAMAAARDVAPAITTAVGHPPLVTPRHVPSRELSIDRDRAASLGVSVATIADTLRLLDATAPVATFYSQGDAVDVHVVLDQPTPDRVLPAVLVPSSTVGAVPLDQLVTIMQRDSVDAILHHDRQRVVALWLRAPRSRRAALRRALAQAVPGATIRDTW